MCLFIILQSIAPLINLNSTLINDRMIYIVHAQSKLQLIARPKWGNLYV